MATDKVAEGAVAVGSQVLAPPQVVLDAVMGAKMLELLGSSMAATGPETGLEAASVMGPGGWFLVAAVAGVGVLVYAAYRCGKIVFRWNDISENDCGGGGQGLATAAGEELQQLRDQLETFRVALTRANNKAAIFQAQLEAERRTTQAIAAERDELRNRLYTVENDNRQLSEKMDQQKVASDERFERLEQQLRLQLPVQEGVME